MKLYKSKVVLVGLVATFLAGVFFCAPQKSLALSWEQVGGNGLGAGAANTLLLTMVEFNDNLYATVGSAAGTKIYRSTNGQTWTQVNTSGFGVATNFDSFLIVHNSTLYAATDTSGAAAAQLWSTTNGTTWTQVGTNGFGEAANTAVVGMEVFNDHLYIGTINLATGAKIFRVTGNTFTPVVLTGFDGTSTNIWSLKEYNGALYAGTGKNAAGGDIWKTTNGNDWSAVMQGGFGDANNDRVGTLFEFGGDLYSGTFNDNTGAEIWRTMASDTNWEQVNTDGFGKATDVWTSLSAAVVNGTVYLGTRNSANQGGRLFASTNGSTWTQEGTAGFGDVGNFAIYAITFSGRIYLAFSNQITGVEIWRTAAMDSLGVTTTSLDEGMVGSSYLETVEKNTAGTTPFVWSVTGTMPDGLNFDEQAGTISGIPTKAGTFTFTVSVADDGAPMQLSSKELSIKINDAVAVLPETGGSRLDWVSPLI